MNNNNAVATTQESKTTQESLNRTKVTKLPTGKVITKEEKEKRRKQHEEQYKTFRVNALKRRAKRMGLTDEQITEKVKELEAQLTEKNVYDILILFNPNNIGLIKESLLNNNIKFKIVSGNYGWLEGDQDVLAKIRELMPSDAKIHPYVKKKPPILQITPPALNKKKPKTKAEKKNAAATAKTARKKKNIERCASRKKRVVNLLEKKRQKASKKKGGTIVQMVHKKPSNSLKKASRTIKKAA